MKLNQVLQFKKGSIVSIVGAGGKTTLMYTLAEELRRKCKVLLTTTTKIFVPKRKQYDFLAMGKKMLEYTKQKNRNGIYVYGSNVNKESKLLAVEPNFHHHLDYFDYILVEADGSKQKVIKGWNENEPVVSKDSTATVGVISIRALGKTVDESNVHRVEKFQEITDTRMNDQINLDHLISVIKHPQGLFKNAVGERVLLINQVETKKEKEQANKLCLQLDFLDQIIVGSLHKKEYW